MSQDISFVRKVVYVAAIALLLFPLFYLGQPATRNSAGGKLAQLRHEHGLAQANLGEIDPASESMKLATLGLRGVAANVLWEKAFEYKKKEDWNNLSATLNQITKLQPNFISVWEFQAHNLSYNVSVEFDNYQHRYHWVKKGISFLIDGTHYNRDNPRLLHQTGWFLGQKIGRADEHVQFRQMFREDEDFHNELNSEPELFVDDGVGYGGRPDNWLVGRLWYQLAERAVEKGIPLKGKSPLIFRSSAPMSLINYASTIEEEGILGQNAQLAWEAADRAWAEYGTLPIPTSWGHNVRLGAHAEVLAECERMQQRLEELLPGEREQVRQEKVAALSPEERSALETPKEELTEENARLHYEAVGKTSVSHEEVAKRAPAELRDKAVKLVTHLVDHETLAKRTAHYGGIVNYEYWKIRCEAEQTKTAVKAREYIYEAKKAHDIADLENAREMYKQAWGKWKKIFDQFPRLTTDVESEELVKSIKRYRRLLQQLDEEIPQDFVLREFLIQREDQDFADLFKGEDTTDAPEGQDTSASSDDGESKPPATDAAAETTSDNKPATPTTDKPPAKETLDTAEPDENAEERE